MIPRRLQRETISSILRLLYASVFLMGVLAALSVAVSFSEEEAAAAASAVE